LDHLVEEITMAKKVTTRTSRSKTAGKRKEKGMAKTDKPNILVIWGDDIGISNLSCYSHGLMGYKTPNIDRIAKQYVA
jgi:arylsulfatase